ISASGRVGGPTTHTFESDDRPPPIPSSWRPLGSGDPITHRKIGSQCAESAGRSCLLKTTAFDVPPRMKVALILLCGIGCVPFVNTIVYNYIPECYRYFPVPDAGDLVPDRRRPQM